MRLAAIALPAPGWGEEPGSAWGRLCAADEWTPVPTDPGAYPTFYAAPDDALRTGGPPPVDPMDAIAGLAIIHAARRSAEQGIVIRL